MNNAPFSKVKSLIERRKLFEQLTAVQGEIICKGDGDSLFVLKPQQVLGGMILQSKLVAIDSPPHRDLSTIGNFHVGADRYFFNGDLKVDKEQALLDLSCNVYQLQRRASFRISIRPQVGLFLAVTEFLGKSLYIIAHVSDISAGGARIFFSNLYQTAGINGTSVNPGLMAGARFKALIHPPSGKVLEVLCEVKHAQKSTINEQTLEQYGIEFVALNERLKNRLTAMGMDLQQRIVTKYVDSL